jgi:outer membrane immunogenic protein
MLLGAPGVEMAKLNSNLLALVVGAVGLCGLAATASADGYQKRGYAPAGCCFSWSGFYVGINGGYGFSADDEGVAWRETFNTTPFFGPGNGGSLDIAGGFGGIQLGYNFQNGRWVFGIEADLQGADISDQSAGLTPYLAGGTATFTSEHQVGWFGTLRPRLGYSWDRTLVYATGGFAWGQVKHSMRWTDGFGFEARDTTSSAEVGYAVGAGIEHAFNCCWSVKLEYQYIDLGSQHYVAPELFGPGGAATAFAIHTDTDTDFHTVRVGLNWKWHDRREAKPLK